MKTIKTNTKLINKQVQQIVGIIGAGVVGLSVAKHLSDQTDQQVIVIE